MNRKGLEVGFKTTEKSFPKMLELEGKCPEFGNDWKRPNWEE